MAANQPLKIEFDILENARDALRHAIELLAWKDIGSDQARLKHAITNIAHAIELLLKERLRRVNPDLIREKAGKERTVTVGEAISRLKKIGGVSFTSDDEQKLKSLKTTRDAIEHYEWRTTEKEANIIVADGLSFAFFFASEHLGTDLAADFKQDDTWRVLIDNLWGFAGAHGARITRRLMEKGEYPFCCDSCGQSTVPLRGVSCQLCGHWHADD